MLLYRILYEKISRWRMSRDEMAVSRNDSGGVVAGAVWLDPAAYSPRH